MKGIKIFAAALLATTALARAAYAADNGPSNAELQMRIDALEQELQANEQRQAAAQAAAEQQAAAPAPAPSVLEGWWNNTKISGRAYIDFSNIEHKSNGVKQSDTGANFDLKRFYVSVDHDFDNIWSADITTDVTYDGTTKASQIFIKKAYLQAKVAGDMLVFRLGSADMPWIPFVEDLYGYRYVENTLIDRTKFGTSADWGAHFLGKLADGLIGYQFSVVNGAGYKVIPIGGGSNRSNSVDVEGRVNLNYDGFVLGLGGYSGKLGKDVEGALPTHHTANRFDAIAAYSTGNIHAGVEYFSANDWNNVTTVTADSSHGWGGFASYKFMPEFAVFGRYDYVTPNHKTNDSLHDKYYNFGLTWSPAKIVDISLVYKHDEASHGTISTSNGTIGGSKSGTYSEVGVFTQLRW
ncbi:MAG: porin [Rhizomicrobium sp.]